MKHGVGIQERPNSHDVGDRTSAAVEESVVQDCVVCCTTVQCFVSPGCSRQQLYALVELQHLNTQRFLYGDLTRVNHCGGLLVEAQDWMLEVSI